MAVQKLEEVSQENQDDETQAVPVKKEKIEFEQSSNIEIQIKPPIISNVNNKYLCWTSGQKACKRIWY
jgi:hypothetical protein